MTSIKIVFKKVFVKNNVEAEVYENILNATTFLQSISAEELTKEELFYKDNDYQMTICIKAVKK